VAIRFTDRDTDPYPYHDTSKMCLGGGMHCPSASSFICDLIYILNSDPHFPMLRILVSHYPLLSRDLVGFCVSLDPVRDGRCTWCVRSSLVVCSVR